MVEWHHQLNGHELEQMLGDGDGERNGDGDGERSLACCSPQDCKELDITEQLNSNSIYASAPKR